MKMKELLLMIKEIFGNKIKIIYKKNKVSSHYEITPYSYRPQIAKKITPNPSYDFGQGVLEAIYDIEKDLNKR